mmetsp:Transcript_98796/g.205954  ORF Transcript_98796/g.205954 Transcript_98796/m.205954 type:complete len:236 (+) Transcript_98796:1537-2244(+)
MLRHGEAPMGPEHGICREGFQHDRGGLSVRKKHRFESPSVVLKEAVDVVAGHLMNLLRSEFDHLEQDRENGGLGPSSWHFSNLQRWGLLVREHSRRRSYVQFIAIRRVCLTIEAEEADHLIYMRRCFLKGLPQLLVLFGVGRQILTASWWSTEEGNDCWAITFPQDLVVEGIWCQSQDFILGGITHELIDTWHFRKSDHTAAQGQIDQNRLLHVLIWLPWLPTHDARDRVWFDLV